VAVAAAAAAVVVVVAAAAALVVTLSVHEIARIIVCACTTDE
jgi:hypothetical protein